MEAMMSHPAMAPNFFYYTPDPSCDSRQQGHFVPRPHAGLQHVFPVVPTLPSTPLLPSTPVYSRPGSACSQPAMHPKIFGGVPLALTPQASPQLMHHKPTIVLDTDLSEADLYYPSTPPLSSSGSVISSPGSCEILQTPLNPMFSGLDGVEGKEVANSDRQLEEFPNLDWSSCASPPMTPVYLQSQAPTQRLGSVCSNSSSTDLSACPSLSPSPAPYARSSSSPEIDFCDPRNLTVGTVNSTLAPDFSALPTLCAADDEDHEFVLRSEALKAEPPSVSPSPSFEFNSDIHHGLPNFEQLDDIESDNDFVNGLVNLGEHIPVQPTRSRASSDAASVGHSSYTCDDEDFEGHSFSDEYLDTPTSTVDDCDAHQHKRQRTSSVEPVINMANDTQSQSGSTQQQSTPAPQNQNSASENKNGSSESNSASDNNPQTPATAPTNRRGRKQSLTEDPSKTFKCELCNRRFRRQEHLKRHYRSLHTQDKPFECNECGKKFSRSDNLAQHSRTHGSGAIIMNLIDDPDAMHPQMHHGYHPMMGGPPMGGAPDFQTLGKVLFHVSAEIPGSSSELSSDEGSDHGRKRKRSD